MDDENRRAAAVAVLLVLVGGVATVYGLWVLVIGVIAASLVVYGLTRLEWLQDTHIVFPLSAAGASILFTTAAIYAGVLAASVSLIVVGVLLLVPDLLDIVGLQGGGVGHLPDTDASSRLALPFQTQEQSVVISIHENKGSDNVPRGDYRCPFCGTTSRWEGTVGVPLRCPTCYGQLGG